MQFVGLLPVPGLPPHLRGTLEFGKLKALEGRITPHLRGTLGRECLDLLH